MTRPLEPLGPEEAVEQYLESRKADATASTVQNHRYRLKPFLEWASERDLENLNELSGRDCENYKNWRIARGGLADVTLEQQLRTFRVFLRYCEAVEAVEQGVSEKLLVPKVSKGEAVRTDSITHEEATAILDYLKRFSYASKEHAIFQLLYHTGMRRGACRALDVGDWCTGEDAYLEVRHRPDASVSTPLKLKDDGERNLSILDPTLVEVLDDYLAHNRVEHVEKDGREPLFTTRNGRIAGGTIQTLVYRVSRPCYYSGDCPHEITKDSCEAYTSSEYYSRCPSSVSPHPIRRSAIEHHLDSNVSKAVASERMAVSVDTLEEHYDSRSAERKREARRSELSNL